MKIYKCLCCEKECQVSHQKTNKYCSVRCQQEYQHKKYITEWQAGLQSGKKGQGEISGYVRTYLFEKFNNTCCKCGINSWQGEEGSELSPVFLDPLSGLRILRVKCLLELLLADNCSRKRLRVHDLSE